MQVTRRYRQRAARAGLWAWCLGFLLGPLVHLAGHRLDHHHGGGGLFAAASHHHDADAPSDPHHHADGAAHLHAAVLPAVYVPPVFSGRLPAIGRLFSVHTPPALPARRRPAQPRAPPALA
ncbi:MAG: hypothetical protein H6706_16190 [Myxococcales bacterium]|nr:hypothetical protein [Myxococcales bacterium]